MSQDFIVEEGSAGERAGARSSLSRRDFLRAGAGAGAGLLVFGLGGALGGRGASAQAAPPGLDVFGGFPRAFFYRHVEGEARSGNLTYAQWESRYLPLGGLIGKVLNEAHDYTDKPNKEWFLRYKAQNPSKMVLLHYNGTGRRATDEATTKFFSGHFLYYTGTRLTRGIGDSGHQSVLHVADTSVFKMKRYRQAEADDIAITRVDSRGRPRWETAEHVRLLKINRRDKTITVRRHLYGTQARTFPKGSYLAAHVTTGPYRYEDTPQQSVPLWNYNFSTACPTDASGRNCADALADYLGEKLGPDGELESLDGIVFDVFSWVIRFGYPIQQIDVNTDGRADRGIIRGENVVSKGALEFLEKLRSRLPDKILLADGHIPRESQRGFGHLNGMESEGYPDKYDLRLDHLSRGENIFEFWKRNSTDPSFNYVNFRYKQRKPERYRNTFTEPTLSQDNSWEKLRLALASALFTDSVFTYSGGDQLEDGPAGDGWLPPEATWTNGPGSPKVRVFDELWRGVDQVQGWLGEPVGDAVHLAAEAPELFGADGEAWPPEFVDRFQGEGVSFSRVVGATGPMLAIRSEGSAGSLSFTLPDIDVTGGDLFVTLRLRADPLEGFPDTVPRRVDVYAVPAGEGLNPLHREFTWTDSHFFDASFYFQDVGDGPVNLRFVVEGRQQVLFQKLTAHAAADGRYREYEGGVVFANPSTREYTFRVAELFPGVTLRRLQGSVDQDTVTNNGNLVGQQLRITQKNALFVMKVPGG